MDLSFDPREYGYEEPFGLKVRYAVERGVALALLVLLLPLFGLISLLIWLEDGRPIFFVQERIGRFGRPFRMWKFRSMIKDASKVGDGLYTGERDPRILRVGKFLRRTSLDELPQLINVVRGEMSFIGPRPTLRYQVELYDAWQRRRLLVKPGVTGWAQVNGRNSLPWEERIRLDVWYVENWSILLDLRILWRTIWVALKGEGLYAPPENFQVKGVDPRRRDGSCRS